MSAAAALRRILAVSISRRGLTALSCAAPSSRTTTLSPVRISATGLRHSSTVVTPVSTSNAPAAVGSYSQGIKAGNLLFVSGNLPMDPITKTIVDGGIEAQTKQVLKNLEAIVEASGSTLESVLKTTVFLQDMGDFTRMDGVYAQFFGSHKPARSTVQVARLPLGVLVEIECIALVK